MIQFPFTLAYTMEIHKAQGSIVSRAVLNISGREFSPGLTYVAVSHVKTLKGILFEEAFNFDLFARNQSESVCQGKASKCRVL